MRPAGIIVLYCVFTFVGGALVAPWLHFFLQSLSGSIPALKGLADSEFHRYVTRCWLVIGLAGLWPLLRALGMASTTEIGLKKQPTTARELGLGLALGFATLALAAVLATTVGPHRWKADETSGYWIKHLMNASLAAMAVPLIEETLFRGVIFGALRKGMDWRMALLISSLAYAFLHFLERPPPPQEVTWSTGLAFLPRMVRGFGNTDVLFPGVFNLCVAGCILGIAFQRTGSLWFAIGLHGGWIFWIKTYGFLTTDEGTGAAWLWGSRKLIDGWMCFPVLLLAVPLVSRLRAPEKNSPATP